MCTSVEVVALPARLARCWAADRGVRHRPLGVLFVVAIYLRALGRTGQTWGRRITRVRVVANHTGEPIGFWRALGRQLFAFTISRVVLALGYLWMLWDDERQTWHDKVADTVAVEA